MTRIEWTEKTWNPVTGCTKISSGCKNCYAEIMHKRLGAMGQAKYQHPFNEVHFHPDTLEIPLKRKKPTSFFVNSMSDLFHEDVRNGEILSVMDTIRQCEHHTFQILTKRAERMRSFMSMLAFDNMGAGTMFLADRGLNRQGNPISFAPVMHQMHLGVSIEDQPSADERVPLLAQTPAALRFLSVEPLLGPIRLDWCGECGGHGQGRHGSGEPTDCGDERECGPSGMFPPVGWVIVGCEKGPKRRPMNIDWVRSLRDQCSDASVPFFLKQMEIDGRVVKLPELDGRQWLEVPK